MKASIQHFQSVIGPVQPILNVALLSLLMWWILRNWLEGHKLAVASLASGFVLNLASIWFSSNDRDELVYKLAVSAATLLVLYAGWHVLRRFEDGADG